MNAELLLGRCPLHFAADMGQLDVVKFLVSKGAEVDVRPLIEHQPRAAQRLCGI